MVQEIHLFLTALDSGSSTAEWVTAWGTVLSAVGTIFLGAVAIWVPRWQIKQESKKRPVLGIDFALDRPHCHKTIDKRKYKSGTEIEEPVYILRFRVKNTGLTPAKSCQAVIEDLEIIKGNAEMVPRGHYTPANLLWGSGFYETFLDIYPQRPYYCGLGRIPSKKLQSEECQSRMVAEDQDKFVDPVTHDEKSKELGFVLEVVRGFKFYSQPNRLPPGKYKLTVALYAQNADPVKEVFIIDWTGVWQDTWGKMKREVTIDASKLEQS